MIKIITLTPFQAAIEVDSQNKIIRTPKKLSNFLNLPFSILEESLKRQKQHFKVEDVIDG
jgi:hypothetical protein